MRAIRLSLAMLAMAALTGCTSLGQSIGLLPTTPAGSPALSPREQAEQFDQEYMLAQVTTLAALKSGALSADAKAKVKGASDITTTAVHAYDAKAELCFRDPITGAVGDAPGAAAGSCDITGLAPLAAAASTALTNLNQLVGSAPAAK